MATAAVAPPKVAGTIRSKNPLKGAVEILPERLYYASLTAPPPSHNILASTPRRARDEPPPGVDPPKKKQIHFFNIDNELVYWNFFLDFGPLNLGQLARFCQKLHDKLRKFPVVCYYSNTAPAKRANAVFLICAWQLLYLDRTPEEAFAGFDARLLTAFQRSTNPPRRGYSRPPVSQSLGSVTLAELPPFHDASPCDCSYGLSVLDCLRGMAKARQHGFYDHESFDVEEYEHFEQVENGDLNWIVKGQILAFAGPSYERHVSPEGYCTLSPRDYLPYFQRRRVGLVVRLNKKCYDEQDFVRAGIRHCDAFFLDGSCPPRTVLRRVLRAMEEVLQPAAGDMSGGGGSPRAVAVHCKAGLGRTGTCIGAYLMKHYRFTAAEAIGWMRVCRPGMVIGPQQHFLRQIEPAMWQEGAASGVVPRPPVRGGGGGDATTSSAASSGSSYGPEPPLAMDNEAVAGRAGQAAALLAARGRRGPHAPEHTVGRDGGTGPVPVTPDAPSTQLWCGGFGGLS